MIDNFPLIPFLFDFYTLHVEKNVRVNNFVQFKKIPFGIFIFFIDSVLKLKSDHWEINWILSISELNIGNGLKRSKSVLNSDVLGIRCEEFRLLTKSLFCTNRGGRGGGLEGWANDDIVIEKQMDQIVLKIRKILSFNFVSYLSLCNWESEIERERVENGLENVWACVASYHRFNCSSVPNSSTQFEKLHHLYCFV